LAQTEKLHKKTAPNVNNDLDQIALIVDSIQDIKGKKIIHLDLRKIEDRPTDHFIICEGDSSTQVRAIAENIKKRVKEELSIFPFKSEGILGAKWILVDYFDIVVHIFYRDTRTYYDIEDLWGDADLKEYEDVV